MLGMTFMGTVVSILLIGVSLLLIGLVLLQKNRGAGLSGAFGGVGGHSAFGTKTGDFLTWVTVGLVAVFLLLNIAGNFVFEPEPIAAQTPTLSPGSPAGTGQNPAAAGGTAPRPVSPAPDAGSTTPKQADPSS